MVTAILFLIVALRAVIELVFWVLAGRTVLALMAGRHGSDNAILCIFDACLKPPRALMAKLLPEARRPLRDIGLFVGLVLLWIGLAFGKWWLTK